MRQFRILTDVLLFVDLDGETQCGSLIEMGAALARGQTVFLVSDQWCSIQNHPQVRKYRKLEDAIDAIVSMWAGMRARRAERMVMQ